MNLLITGANRGLGLALAAEALRRGHRVLAGTRSPHDAGSKLDALRSAFPDRLSVHILDVAREEHAARLAAELAEQGVVLDGIINNAGILLGRDSPIEQLDMDQVRQTFEINLFGPMTVVKHMLPLMAHSAGGIILNISSEAGSLTNAYGGDYPYAISKTALNMFTEQLKHAVKDRGIRALSVHPGWIRTDMGGGQAPGDPRESAAGILDLAEGKTVPDGRFAFVDYLGRPMAI
jgi:NAD(P)-dependent dehydrogenase (short-subunit alcohol dehydrogenase family)